MRLALMISLAAMLAACSNSTTLDQCDAPGLTAGAVQGRESTSALLGQTVQLQLQSTAVLRGDDDQVLGVFAQTLPDQQDDDPITSEGLLLLHRQLPAGRVVRVSGTVTEFGDDRSSITALEVDAFSDCGPSPVTAVESIELPLKGRPIEAVEGMLVHIDQPLVLSGVSQLGRRGELMAATGGRLYQPTEVAAPGQASSKVYRDNLKRSIRLDDLTLAEHTQARPVWQQAYPDGVLPAAGDRWRAVTGVISHHFGYRLHLTEAPEQVRPVREDVLPARLGNLRVAALNLLNYFNGDGRGGGFPTPRGARNAQELARQQAKLAKAITRLDADLLALAELENDAGETAAVRQLARAISVPGVRWQAIANPTEDGRLGVDDIAVGLIYRADRMRPVGRARTLLEAPFDQYNRPPLLQTFEHIASGQQLTVVSLHLKSKGCSNAAGDNADQRDGQGCWNPKRLEAARALTRWIDSIEDIDPDRVIVLGDFNAYAREEPISWFVSKDYVSLAERFEDDRDPVYTYVYNGAAGSLDHALASRRLTAQVTQAFVWHINADQPDLLEYRSGLSDEGSVLRASDHDPLILDLSL